MTEWLDKSGNENLFEFDDGNESDKSNDEIVEMSDHNSNNE